MRRRVFHARHASRDAKGDDGDASKDSRRNQFDFPPVDKDRAFACIEAMRPIAQAHGVSVAQIALAWLLNQPQVTSMIVGAKRPEQLKENLGSSDVSLSAEELKVLDDVSCLPAEYPGWMLERQGEYRKELLAKAQRTGVEASRAL